MIVVDGEQKFLLIYFSKKSIIVFSEVELKLNSNSFHLRKTIASIHLSL